MLVVNNCTGSCSTLTWCGYNFERANTRMQYLQVHIYDKSISSSILSGSILYNTTYTAGTYLSVYTSLVLYTWLPIHNRQVCYRSATDLLQTCYTPHTGSVGEYTVVVLKNFLCSHLTVRRAANYGYSVYLTVSNLIIYRYRCLECSICFCRKNNVQKSA